MTPINCIHQAHKNQFFFLTVIDYSYTASQLSSTISSFAHIQVGQRLKAFFKTSSAEEYSGAIPLI